MEIYTEIAVVNEAIIFVSLTPPATTDHSSLAIQVGRRDAAEFHLRFPDDDALILSLRVYVYLGACAGTWGGGRRSASRHPSGFIQPADNNQHALEAIKASSLLFITNGIAFQRS